MELVTGTRYYPSANSTVQRFDDDYPGDVWSGSLEKCVWHSTETEGWPSYDGGSKAPNFTVKGNFTTQKLEWRQHFPVNMSSRALRNLDGGVQTNRDRCVQVEIVGTCDPVRHSSDPDMPYTPTLPDWFLSGLAAFVAWLDTEWDIPISASRAFLAYPGSYGATNNRLTGSEWNPFRGHCGHQHVPENTHGDPGAIKMNSVMATARTIIDPVPPPVPPAPLSEGDNDMFIARTASTTDDRVFLCVSGYKRQLSYNVYVELRDKAKLFVCDLSDTTLGTFKNLDSLELEEDGFRDTTNVALANAAAQVAAVKADTTAIKSDTAAIRPDVVTIKDDVAIIKANTTP